MNNNRNDQGSWVNAAQFGAEDGETGTVVLVNKQQEGSRAPKYSIQFLSQKVNGRDEVYRSPYIPVYTAEKDDRSREVRSNAEILAKYISEAEAWITEDLRTFNQSLKKSR